MRMRASADGREQSHLVALVERRVELRVLAVNGYGDVSPDGERGGAAIVQELEEMLDGGGLGQLDGVAVAVEEFFQEAEVEDVDGHSYILPLAFAPFGLFRSPQGSPYSPDELL
jgi:hypothetical protein